MDQITKKHIEYRCPLCFSKEVDMPLLFDRKLGEYYCIRCCYVGNEDDICSFYERIKLKYKLLRSGAQGFNVARP